MAVALNAAIFGDYHKQGTAAAWSAAPKGGRHKHDRT